jgi:galactose-1-phosphate uridylyltransferase
MTDPGKFEFKKERIQASFINPSGALSENIIEVRTNPLTFRSCRITYSRTGEKEAGTEVFPDPPPFAHQTAGCPFCRPQVLEMTPQLLQKKFPSNRLVVGESILFPNLFPYGGHSAVSLFDQNHFVEIGTASLSAYADSFKNSIQYLGHVSKQDPGAVYTAITQNHLPSAGGSLLHPHLQIHADRIPGNHHRFFEQRCRQYYQDNQAMLFSDYLNLESAQGERTIGTTGEWHWISAFAPEGFFEIWGILPGVTSLLSLSDMQIKELCAGVLNTQKFYRSLNRNGYNLGILCIEKADSLLELRVVLMVRCNYVPWARNDHTGFELMLGDMATFVAPELTAELARPFWRGSGEVSRSSYSAACADEGA